MTMQKKDSFSHRVGTQKLRIQFEGRPLKNAQVVIRQKKHKFLFGGFDFNAISVANNELDDSRAIFLPEIFRKFVSLFNYATLPFYWEESELEKEQHEFERLKKTAEWLKSQGFAIKGHPLCWHTLCPESLLKLTNPQIKKELLARIERVMNEFSGLIDIWDVINEPVIMPVFDKYDNGMTRLSKDIGRIGIIKETFANAKKINSDAQLLINDFVYTSIDSYEILIEGCLEASVPIDAIGIQSHMHQGYWGVERTQYILERFSRFRLPIHFTESTLVSGHNMPPDIVDFNDYIIDDWATTPEGEEKQAIEAVTHYKTLFANPYVESITWWEFIDGNWLGAPVGLITKDGRAKPAYHKIYELIKEKWWTSSYNSKTDETGVLMASGFFGEYEIICNDKKGVFSLAKENADNLIVVDVK
ncbi:MAG: endo-1,4-beta-xylanase [Lachnospiraceae bacterium]|nr:endo-1,4-beta-xylanase [Lachnospiraceae bacterium]